MDRLGRHGWLSAPKVYNQIRFFIMALPHGTSRTLRVFTMKLSPFACTALLFDCISLISIRIYYTLLVLVYCILYRIRRLFVPLSLLSSCCEKVQLVIIVENSTRTKLLYHLVAQLRVVRTLDRFRWLPAHKRTGITLHTSIISAYYQHNISIKPT